MFKNVVAGLGLIFTGIIISSIQLHSSLAPLQIFSSEIFNTNCLYLFSEKANIEAFTQRPQACQAIQTILPASLIANGLIIILAGITKYLSLISILNLLVFMSMYCNPLIDSSFRSYSHFLEIMVCIFALLINFFKQDQTKPVKNG